QREYEAYVAALVQAGEMPESSYVWGAVRPALAHPTLELRAPASSTLVEGSHAIPAPYRALIRHLYRNRWPNYALNTRQRAIIVENKWQAQRCGVHATFAGEDGAMTVAEMLERVIADIAADAEEFGCVAELDRCRAIVGAGTSADAQLAVFEASEAKGGRDEALRAVSECIAPAPPH